MRAEQLREFLAERRVVATEEAIQYGVQFRCPAGEIVSVFDTGRVSIQGRRTELSTQVEDWVADAQAGANVAPAQGVVRAAPQLPRVFVVYGHDVPARDSLELLLRRMGLEPILLANLPAAGDTVIEKLERYLGDNGDVSFACVLLTPDDEAHPAGVPEEKRYRARQNVVLELGMVLVRLGRPRVAILYKRSVELPSDINGLIYIPFDERVDEVRAPLFRELQAAGLGPRAEAL